MRGTRPPQWATGIFYPLVVAGLLGIFVTLLGLKEDVAVIKVKVQLNEKQLERLMTSKEPRRTWEVPR